MNLICEHKDEWKRSRLQFKKIISISAQEMVLIHTVLSQPPHANADGVLGHLHAQLAAGCVDANQKQTHASERWALLRRSVMVSSLSLHTWTHMEVVTGKSGCL